jgi:alpha-tubulin suppressor-like RCC1 family protein
VRFVGVIFVLGLGACYQGPAADGTCRIRCTDGCPEGMTCQDGFCVGPGGTCEAADAGLDATATCGLAGKPCCATGPACTTNTSCVAGTCERCVTQVGLGRHHSCALVSGGEVWCAGANGSGQLGDGTQQGPRTSAVRVTDGTGPIADATAVDSGRSFGCAIRAGGTVWCWGSNGAGQLGNGSTSPSAVAVRVVRADGSPLEGATSVQAAYAFACALDVDGAVWCWGDNARGQLGDGGLGTRAHAARAQLSSGEPLGNVTQLSVGHAHACAVIGGSEVRCWGANEDGRIGDGSEIARNRAVMVTAGTAVGAGPFHTCALHADSTVSCWGSGWHRRLGADVSNFEKVHTPTAVLRGPGQPRLDGVTAIAVGSVSCAVMADDSALCWGSSVHGQTGNGGNPYPAAVRDDRGVPLTSVERIDANFAHACAHLRDGRALCWGRNTEGAFGDGLRENHGLATALGISCP